ncbi:MAG: DUF1593 domain-containing protein [Sphingomonas fennica]
MRRHSAGYPDAALLAGVVRSGSAAYGMAGVGDGRDTAASRRIVEVVDRADARPVYVSVWGGAADLAQALWTVRATRTPDAAARFVASCASIRSRIRTTPGPWIRQQVPVAVLDRQHPRLGRIRAGGMDRHSGDLMRPDKWPRCRSRHQRLAGTQRPPRAAGASYPPHKYIMEGDTPAFLGLIDNGLGMPDRPEWGGWGGRYVPAYEGAALRSDAMDSYVDPAGRRWTGNQATIYRWRRAFQHDFAARIGWTLTPERAKANHNPALMLNGVAGTAPLALSVRAGASVRLDAAGSRDPDGDALAYRWWPYPEPGLHPGEQRPMPTIAAADTATATFTAPRVTEPTTYHIILEVTDDGAPALTSYRRALVTVTPDRPE